MGFRVYVLAFHGKRKLFPTFIPVLLLLATVRLEVLVSAQAWLSVSAFRITVIVARLDFSLLWLLQHSFPSGR